MRKLVAKVGTYQKGGETKNRYQDIGAMLSNSNGEYIILNPSISLAGILAQQNAMSGESRTNVMISIFDNDKSQAPQQKQQSKQDDFDDDIPF